MILFCLFFWSKSEQTAAQERDVTQAVEFTLTMKAMIDEARRVLEAVAADPSLVWNDIPTLDNRLIGYERLFPYSRGVIALTASGSPIAPSWVRQIGGTAKDQPWFQNAVRTKDFVVGPFVVSRLTNRPVLPLGLPITHSSNVAAVLAISIDLDWVYDQAQLHGLPPESTINLVGLDRTVLVRYPNPELYVGKVYADSPMVRAAASAQTSQLIESPGLDGHPRLYAIQPLRWGDLFLGSVSIGISLSEIHQLTSKALTVTALLFAFVLILGAAASVIGMRSLVLKPISRISAYASVLSAGDFSSRVDLLGLPPELSVLAASVNAMAAALEIREDELKKYRDHLEETVAERTKELEASRRELERSNAELQQFAYVASHDLQEPLRMVASFTQLLAQKYAGALDDQAQQYIGFAVDGATRMQQLINDLLMFSRIETQARKLGAVESSVSLSLALSNLAVRVQETGAVIEHGRLPVVIADSIQISQVFQNLIGNAIKFNKSIPPRVWVNARVLDGMAEFRVEDNGIGISAEFSERVFVIFQRLNPRSEFPGTGIGLALCKRIVDRHGGRIWFEPSSHGGTCFVFTLPVSQGDSRD
jgi:signal transduction histidine kinase